jgi:hypothetical protein
MNSIDTLKFVDGNFISSDAFSDMVYDNEGSFTEKDQSMSFEYGDTEVVINYELYVDGTIEEESGDWWTPGSCEVFVTDTDITINEVFVDGVLTNVDTQDLTKLEKLIKTQLS